ncbi:MAG TPA: lipoate--protein ligase family protein [Verrucomicrobiae bacterium]|nr:lipoate--protein ligase family protein [Verrucomicrobiae bacterium]
MKYFEKSYAAPEENLAADEALLELAEERGIETLRIWESAVPFVVLGLSNHVSVEVVTAACAQRGIPILRRVSGGGTVVQGPGCLSYALTLLIPEAGPLATITGTNRQVMEIHRAALENLLGEPVAVQGHTDLETGGRKFSGNAQKRGRRALLFHGTILHAADLELINQLLRHPSREPDWRGRRAHAEFIANLPATRKQITAALRMAWKAGEPLDSLPAAETMGRLAQRHGSSEWVNRRP